MNTETHPDESHPSQDSHTSSKGRRRSLIAAAAVVALVALLASLWYATQGRLAAAEDDAKSQLKSLGVLLVSGNSGHVGSANLSLVRSETDFDQAVELVPHLHWLEVLDFSGKKITANQLAKLTSLGQLESLHLANTDIDDSAAESIARFSSLGALHLSGTHLTSESLPELGNLTSLTVLDLSHTKISGNLASLANLANLKWLVLRGVPLDDDAIETLTQLPSLSRLTLEEGQITTEQHKILRQKTGIHVDGMDASAPDGQ